MADYLAEALQGIQQQSLAQNPYAQFGSVLSQQKNPYATADDPWGALAANAAQQLFAGMAGGYGQAQVGQQMQQIAPLVPGLYSDPSSVQNPGLDASVFGNLQIAAQNDRAARQKALQDLYLTESVKQGLNPQAPLFNIQAKREQMKYVQELGALLGIDPTAIQQATGQSVNVPAGQVPAASDVFKGPPATAPTQESQPQAAPNQVQLESVPDQRALLQQKLASGVPYEEAIAATNKEIADINNENRKRITNQQEISARSSADKELADYRQNIELANKRDEANKDFNTVDQAMKVMGNALKELPNYAGYFGGVEYAKDKQIAAYAPEGSPQREAAAKRIAAVSTLESIAPIIVAPIRKEVLSGSTSDFDVQFLLRPVPDKFNIKESNIGIYNRLKQAIDIRKAEMLYRSLGQKQNLSEQQITNNFNQIRAAMGGSFLDSSGTLKPQFNKLLTSLGGNL